jgi:hypothetical protein
MKKILTWGGTALAFAVVLVGVANIATSAQESEGGFALQVSPSPLVTTIKPGETKTLELRIRNEGNKAEELQIQPREFDVDKNTGEIKLKDTKPAEISDWITFGNQTFIIQPDKWSTQKITIALPEQTGFSYSLALVVSRANGEQGVESGAALSGSVAVFTLIKVDRPGATRKFEVTDLKATTGLYEYLPAEFDVTFFNSGNTIVQPTGNVFIQRGSNDGNPISVLPVNSARGYLLPNAPRTIRATWDAGFPAYKTTTDADGQQKRELIWDWTKITDFRIGQYTAKVVAVYNDGQRDVPIQKEITFWVFPWRAALFLIAVIAFVVLIGHKLIQRKVRKAVARSKK